MKDFKLWELIQGNNDPSYEAQPNQIWEDFLHDNSENTSNIFLWFKFLDINNCTWHCALPINTTDFLGGFCQIKCLDYAGVLLMWEMSHVKQNSQVLQCSIIEYWFSFELHMDRRTNKRGIFTFENEYKSSPLIYVTIRMY